MSVTTCSEGAEVIRRGRQAARSCNVSESERPTPGAVYLRVIARALEKHLQQDANCAVHWIAVIDEANTFGPPGEDEVWDPDWDDYQLQIGITEGNSEGMLIYVHAQASRYRPAELVPLLRIKVLCGIDRAVTELVGIHRWFQSEAFANLLRTERAWATFEQIDVGSTFFDPKCGEHFQKTTPLRARCLSGGDAQVGEDDVFQLTDRVQRASQAGALQATT